MFKKFLTGSTNWMNGMMDDPESMLYKLVQTAQNIRKMERYVELNYWFLWVFFALECLSYIYCLINLRPGILILTSPVLLFVFTIWAGLLFAVASNYEKFNFRRRKRANVIICILYATRLVISVLSHLYCQTLLPAVFMIPLSRDITAGMVIWLARLLYALATLGPGVALGYVLNRALVSDENWQAIEAFKLRKILDTRKNKAFLYDLKIIRRMDDGSLYTIKEKDRQRHILLSGVTGTGKTSSALVPSVAQDLDQKVYNEDYVKRELLGRIITKGDIHPIQNMGISDFDIKKFHAETKEGQEFIDALLQKAPSAGITIIAPNADFADAVYDLATSRGFRVNRVDPLPANPISGEMKEGFIGFNPLYISPSLSPRQRKLEIFRKSRMFSDVLQALYDQSGKSDPYFTSLNRNLTTMLTILILITFPTANKGSGGGQPHVTDIQEVINDFSCVRKYLLALAQIMEVDKGETDPTKVTAEWCRARKFGEYQFIVSQISYDLLGVGRQDMEKQARGLRVIINEFLTDPLIRGVLCAPETVDIDRCLAEGQITVVNYALELGMSIATGFGLFYCLSFNQAVLRRPGTESTRLLHIYDCDEFPLLLHRDTEQIFTLYRQFKVCFLCAFQTFSQFDRNEETKYLKKVILSNAGHHIVYGHCSPEEMELYEQLAGKEIKFIEQETVSQTALSAADTSMSFSTRTTPSLENAVEGYRMRNKDFQEVTVFGINNGDHVPPFDGKLSFLTEKQRKGVKRCEIDWSMFVVEKTENATFFDAGATSETESSRIHEEYHAAAKEMKKMIEDARRELGEIPAAGNKMASEAACVDGEAGVKEPQTEDSYMNDDMDFEFTMEEVEDGKERD